MFCGRRFCGGTFQKAAVMARVKVSLGGAGDVGARRLWNGKDQLRPDDREFQQDDQPLSDDGQRRQRFDQHSDRV